MFVRRGDVGGDDVRLGGYELQRFHAKDPPDQVTTIKTPQWLLLAYEDKRAEVDFTTCDLVFLFKRESQNEAQDVHMS